MTGYERQELRIDGLVGAYVYQTRLSNRYWVKPSSLKTFIEAKYCSLYSNFGSISQQQYICRTALVRFKLWLKRQGYAWDKHNRCWEKLNVKKPIKQGR